MKASEDVRLRRWSCPLPSRWPGSISGPPPCLRSALLSFFARFPAPSSPLSLSELLDGTSLEHSNTWTRLRSCHFVYFFFDLSCLPPVFFSRFFSVGVMSQCCGHRCYLRCVMSVCGTCWRSSLCVLPLSLFMSTCALNSKLSCPLLKFVCLWVFLFGSSVSLSISFTCQRHYACPPPSAPHTTLLHFFFISI